MRRKLAEPSQVMLTIRAPIIESAGEPGSEIGPKNIARWRKSYKIGPTAGMGRPRLIDSQ